MTEAINVYDTAHQLAREITQTGAYQEVKKAVSQVKDDPEAKKMLENLMSLQEQLSKQEASGQEVDQEKLQELQKLYLTASKNKKFARLFEKEQELNILMNDLNQAIFDPITRLYQD